MPATWRGWRRGWRAPMPRVEVLADGAERYLALRDRDDRRALRSFDAARLCRLPEEIRLRLLHARDRPRRP